MPRRPRKATGGVIYHVLNRGVGRRQIFTKNLDYLAFLAIIAETQQKLPCRLLAYCLMPNHWHLLLWPEQDGELSEFMRLLTVTHVQRWHAHFKSSGTGSIYQGRFKSFPVKSDEHFLTVARYVERNAKRANLVERAEDWRWSSLAVGRFQGLVGDSTPKLHPWPVLPPTSWIEIVNRAETASELLAVRKSVEKGSPFGDQEWQHTIAAELGIQSSLRRRGRPNSQLADHMSS